MHFVLWYIFFKWITYILTSLIISRVFSSETLMYNLFFIFDVKEGRCLSAKGKIKPGRIITQTFPLPYIVGTVGTNHGQLDCHCKVIYFRELVNSVQFRLVLWITISVTTYIHLPIWNSLATGNRVLKSTLKPCLNDFCEYCHRLHFSGNLVGLFFSDLHYVGRSNACFSFSSRKTQKVKILEKKNNIYSNTNIFLPNVIYIVRTTYYVYTLFFFYFENFSEKKKKEKFRFNFFCSNYSSVIPNYRILK